MRSFAELFKHYRLRSGFGSLSEFGNSLADKGYFYEDSIFSHWQKGTRIPTNRRVILAIITVFIEHGGIISAIQTNGFLESAGHGYLTDKERSSLFVTQVATPVI